MDSFPKSEQNELGELVFFDQNLRIGLTLPEKLTESDLLSREFTAPVISLETDTNNPAGKLSMTVKKAVINGQTGFLLDIITRSDDEQLPDLEHDAILTWVDQAKKVQRLVFDSIIE